LILIDLSPMPTKTTAQPKTERATRAMATKTNTRKRAASPEPKAAPPKRTKKENKEVAAPTRKKPAAKAAKATKPKAKAARAPVEEDVDAEPPKKRVKKEVKEPIPIHSVVPVAPSDAINALPVPPAHERPGAILFFWGAGNFGQFGMGPNVLGEYGKPKKNTWVENGVEEGLFGDEGAGIEAVVAGGLHTIFLDETGRVSHSHHVHISAFPMSPTDLDLRCQR
jgi:regulator of chromosome condensation